MTYQSVNDILKIDQQHRYLGVTGDLFPLDTLETDNSWHFDLPTLTSKLDKYSKKGYVRDISEFKDKFFRKFRVLNNINMDGLTVAGGAVKSILINESAKDIDLFVYGFKTQEEATRRIEKIVVDIYENVQKIKSGHYAEELMSKDYKLNASKPLKSKKVPRKGGNNTDENDNLDERTKMLNDIKANHPHLYDEHISEQISAVYNGNTVNLFVDNQKLQIVLRLYSTPSEILHGFDLGSSAVGFDGKQVYFTTLSKFCYENMVNIFDGTRRSTTYENRLVKYFRNGFNIILPNMDIKKLSSKYFKYNLSEVCELPHMTFSYDNIDGNLIFVKEYFNKYGTEVDTDYEFYSGDDEDNSIKLLHYNLKQLIAKTNRYVNMLNVTDDLKVYQSKNNDLNGWKLNFEGKIMQYKFVEYVYGSQYKKLNENVIDLDAIKRFFNVIDLNDFVNSVYLAETNLDKRKELLDTIFTKQKQWIKDKLKELSVSSNIKWLTDNPTTQLTSSFNPIIEDNALWYGQYYLKTDK